MGLLRLLRHYWPLIPIAVLLVGASYLEWSHAQGPRERSHAAAPQIAAPTALQPPVPTAAKATEPQQHAAIEPKVGADNDATPNNGANKSTADWWLVFFTAGLLVAAVLTYLSIRRQADIMAGTLAQMGDDAKLARDEFNATHRPRMCIQEARYDRHNDRIEYTIVNIGEAPAVIVRSMIVAETLIRLGAAVNYRPAEGRNDLGAIELAPGEFRDLTFNTFTEHFMMAIGAAIEQTMDPGIIHFAGAIVYRDKAGALRRMVFRRSYDPVTSRFQVWRNDPDFDWAA